MYKKNKINFLIGKLEIKLICEKTSPKKPSSTKPTLIINYPFCDRIIDIKLISFCNKKS